LIDAVYNKLGPVKPELMLGEWGGGILDTGHPIGDTLKEIRWVGREFLLTPPNMLTRSLSIRMARELAGESGALQPWAVTQLSLYDFNGTFDISAAT
jgi:hypothetical protein